MSVCVYFYLPHKTKSDLSSRTVLLETLTGDDFGFQVIENVHRSDGEGQGGNLPETLLVWTSTFPSSSFFKSLLPPALKGTKIVINHFPRSVECGHKSRLYHNLDGKDFLPRSFAASSVKIQEKGRKDAKRQKVAKEHESSNMSVEGLRGRLKRLSSEGDATHWITKPQRGGGGRRIQIFETEFLLNELGNAGSGVGLLPFKCPCVFQKYVPNPFLIEGRKVDLRAYVLVLQGTQSQHGGIYAYREGLVRFASKKFTMSPVDLNDPYVHVTNNSVNKRNSVNHGATENMLFSETFQDNGVWERSLFPQLKRIAFCTFTDALLEHENVKRGVRACYGPYSAGRNLSTFELFGVDLLLDQDMKLHLLEVNHMPELETSAKAYADTKMNPKLVKDMFHLVCCNGSSLDSKKEMSLFVLCGNDCIARKEKKKEEIKNKDKQR
eukprot:g1049.t1